MTDPKVVYILWIKGYEWEHPLAVSTDRHQLQRLEKSIVDARKWFRRRVDNLPDPTIQSYEEYIEGRDALKKEVTLAFGLPEDRGDALVDALAGQYMKLDKYELTPAGSLPEVSIKGRALVSKPPSHQGRMSMSSNFIRDYWLSTKSRQADQLLAPSDFSALTDSQLDRVDRQLSKMDKTNSTWQFRAVRDLLRDGIANEQEIRQLTRETAEAHRE